MGEPSGGGLPNWWESFIMQCVCQGQRQQEVTVGRSPTVELLPALVHNPVSFPMGSHHRAPTGPEAASCLGFEKMCLAADGCTEVH